jgi:hypothetical protein
MFCKYGSTVYDFVATGRRENQGRITGEMSSMPSDALCGLESDEAS